MPTEPSFRLADLSESLGFIHENPHQADSDAEVTGQLLLLIEERMRKLPIITLEQMSGKYGLSKFIASYRSAFLLPVFNT
ncbi:hypothetical protein EfmAA610_20290 [Enterococcus faecium]|nr:hypothetical protein EfmAA610_20290 [Enterococcus faecium]